MARKPVSVFKRPTSKKGQFRYYVKLWDEGKGAYGVPRSATQLAREMALDEKAFPPTSRTGALLIGEELRRRGNSDSPKAAPLFADYCANFWEWESSSYIQGKLARDQRIGREYVSHNAAYIKNYIRPAFQSLRLTALRPYMIEEFTMKLKKESGLGNRSINAILAALVVPLHEAARLGLIPSDPASSIRKLPNDTKEKGIPTEEEVRSLLNLYDLEPRIRVAIMLGTACALRIGEIQALKLSNFGKTTLTVSNSWAKIEKLKETKTRRIRVVPLPRIIRDEVLALSKLNPHGPEGFLIYGLQPDAPLDVRAIERGLDNALVRISLGNGFTLATKEEKKLALAAWKDRNITFHSLRHWSNAMLRGSVSDEKLHLFTGHSTDAMTIHYDHTTQADLAELAQAQEIKIMPFITMNAMAL